MSIYYENNLYLRSAEQLYKLHQTTRRSIQYNTHQQRTRHSWTRTKYLTRMISCQTTTIQIHHLFPTKRHYHRHTRRYTRTQILPSSFRKRSLLLIENKRKPHEQNPHDTIFYKITRKAEKLSLTKQ